MREFDLKRILARWRVSQSVQTPAADGASLRGPSINVQKALQTFTVAAAIASAQILGSVNLGFGLKAILLSGFGALLLAMMNGRERTPAAEAAAVDADVLHHAAIGADAIFLKWNLLTGKLEWFGTPPANLALPFDRMPATFPELRSYIHPDDSLYGEIAHALKTRAPKVAWKLRMQGKDGTWEQFELRAGVRWPQPSAAQAKEGPIVEGVLLYLENEAEAEAVSKHNSALAAALESLPISFALWDQDHRLITCNRKFRQTYKVSINAAVSGATVEELEASALETICQGVHAPGAGLGRFQVFDAQLGDGTWLQVGEHHTADGNFVSMATDITALKLSERRLFEREQELKATVRDLEESRLRLEFQTAQLRDLAERYSAEKTRAEAANKAKSEFLANVSHELRTPLNAIIGFSDLMREQTFGPLGHAKYASYAQDIIDSGRYLLEFINDILDMAKIDAGRVKLKPELFSIGALFEDCLRVISPAANERNITLSEGGNLQAMLCGDYRALKQVLINLLANAVKFTMPGGQVQLKVYRYRGSVRLAITDNGVGIAKHDIQRLAQPFEQLENQLTKGHKGSGLGLAISRSLIELHGGKLEIRSKLGEGTTVTCILPTNEGMLEPQREAA